MFTQFFYFPLLIITAIIYWSLKSPKSRSILLTIVSLTVIYYLDQNALLVVLLLTMFTYFIANLIDIRKRKKPYLIFGLCGIILLLLFFKYNNLLVGTLNSLNNFYTGLPDFNLQYMIMPLGISYLVFKYISFMIDIYWQRVQKSSFLSLLTYGSLFTIFSAGPIERFAYLQPQLYINNQKFDKSYIRIAFIRVSMGLFKKLVLADWLGYFIKPVWLDISAFSPFIVALSIVGYSLQIYFDFAGYSDIAIGSSKLLGINVMENFDNPYLAKNISDFWRRWHISLSLWIRDYLFMPLSKLSYIREWMIYLVPPISMSICGLWHGADGHFVFWGLCHGLAIDLYQYFRKTKIKIIKILRKSSLFTFLVVSLFWMIFMGKVKLGELQPIQYFIILVTLPLLLYPIQIILSLISSLKLVNGFRTALVLLIFTIALQCFMNTGFIYMNF